MYVSGIRLVLVQDCKIHLLVSRKFPAKTWKSSYIKIEQK